MPFLQHIFVKELHLSVAICQDAETTELSDMPSSHLSFHSSLLNRLETSHCLAIISDSSKRNREVPSQYQLSIY